MGDENSVSGTMQTQLECLGFSVNRYGGAGRYETAVLIDDAYFHYQTDALFVTNGTNLPDALAAAAVAGRPGAPIYITPPQCTPQVVADSIGRHYSRSRVVMGDPSSVSEPAANLVACP
ncbi:cell wall-binding repeat-containing protein [Microbacterium sp. SS28]|uniref:cell wall-binding repeat-containing protein n=1 Tax=Microbacterium sp. SS28 TaxID=2919948 RepID=UPI001FA9D304|nr:cell wall-binding repeat-containing protein [Microbacterium sp. SS28]